MREILFRGKRVDNGRWVIGSLFTSIDKYYIFPLAIASAAHKSEVVTDTVGQYTGMTDKNDKKIFEGDIVRDASGVIYPVVWGLTGFFLKYSPPHAHGFHYDLLPLSNYWHAHGAIIEVIGNVHDHPELLEVSE